MRREEKETTDLYALFCRPNKSDKDDKLSNGFYEAKMGGISSGSNSKCAWHIEKGLIELKVIAIVVSIRLYITITVEQSRISLTIGQSKRIFSPLAASVIDGSQIIFSIPLFVMHKSGVAT